jgi:ATP-dependent DNA helicase RecQ
MNSLEARLGECFGFEGFRSRQRKVIAPRLQSQHTLTVLPTGAVKSLCYPLTAQMLPGMMSVVSPLIALRQDQVNDS